MGRNVCPFHMRDYLKRFITWVESLKARALPSEYVELVDAHSPVDRVVDRNRIWTRFTRTVRSNFEYTSPCNKLCFNMRSRQGLNLFSIGLCFAFKPSLEPSGLNRTGLTNKISSSGYGCVLLASFSHRHGCHEVLCRT